MLATFRSGPEALLAMNYDDQEVAGQKVKVRLLTPDWQQKIEQELNLVRSNTAALYKTTTHSLLGEDFSLSTMSFDMDGGYENRRVCKPSVNRFELNLLQKVSSESQ